MNGQLQTLWDVGQRWRIDGLEFVRRDVPKIAVVLVIAFVLTRLLHVLTRRLTAFSQRQELAPGIRSQQLRTLASVINGIGMFVILFVTAMQILPVLGINMGPLLASAGVAGLAIGFGAQTLVHDVINGFFILLENQYSVGDGIRVSGVAGTVEQMTLRRTVLRDADGTLHTIPNSQITVVSNLTRDWTLTSLHVSAGYPVSADRVIALLSQIGTELRQDPEFSQLLLADPQVPGIDRVAAGEVDYLMLIKTKPGAQFAVVRELRRRIKDSFEKNHIQPAGPAPLYVMSQLPGQDKQ
jgi:small conductance mechanosensitive channel